MQSTPPHSSTPLLAVLLALLFACVGSTSSSATAANNVFASLDCYQGAQGFDSVTGEATNPFDPYYYGKPQLHKIGAPILYNDPLAGHMFISQWNGKWIEGEEQHVLKEFLLLGKNTKSTQHNSQGHRNIVIDVGANDGIYSTIAARRGFPVLSFELQPFCMNIMRSMLGFNHISPSQVCVVRRPVLHKDNLALEIASHQWCEGKFAIDRFKPRVTKRETLNTVTLDTVVPPNTHIKLLKVDVEGYEWAVLQGAKGLFRDKRVDRAVVESFHWVDKVNSTAKSSMEDVSFLFDCGYVLQCLRAWSGDEAKDRQAPNQVPFANKVWRSRHEWMADRLQLTTNPSNRFHCIDLSIFRE